MTYLNKSVIIIDNSDLSYSGEDINGTLVRGTEASLILLSEQFVRMGINVDYCNSIQKKSKFNGVNYFNKNDIIKQVQPNIQLNSVWQYIRRYLLEIGVKDNHNSPYTSYSIPEKLKKDLTSLTKNVKLELTPRQKSEKVVVKKHDWF